MGHLYRISEAELKRYDEYFSLLDEGRQGVVEIDAALPLFEKSQLQPEQLDDVWDIAGVGDDDLLTLPMFRAAMHLTMLMVKGHPLPSSLPLALAQSAGLPPPRANSAAVAAAFYISDADRRRYDDYFSLLDEGRRGVLGVDAALPLFEKSQLQPELLDDIWDLAGVGDDDLLTLPMFRAAMHLTMLMVKGYSLPSSMPLVLAQSAGLAPTVGGWPISGDEAAEAIALFDSRATNGHLTSQAAYEVLVQSQLSTYDLEAIWRVADADQDGQLKRDEFIVAMHLVRRRHAGEDWSTMKPDANAETASGNGTAPVAGTAAVTQALQSPSNSSMFSSAAFTSQWDKLKGVSWALAGDKRTKYANLFRTKLEVGDNGFARKEQVVPFFSRSKLPLNEIDVVWRLADVDADDALSIDEFCVAMHLVTLRKSGKDLPHELPAELVPESSKWELTPEQRVQFGSAFETVGGNDASRVPQDRARRHFLRYGLPPETVDRVLHMIAPAGGRLDELQFCLANLLLSRINQGAPVPRETPVRLRKQLEGHEEIPMLDIASGDWQQAGAGDRIFSPAPQESDPEIMAVTAAARNANLFAAGAQKQVQKQGSKLGVGTKDPPPPVRLPGEEQGGGASTRPELLRLVSSGQFPQSNRSAPVPRVQPVAYQATRAGGFGGADPSLPTAAELLGTDTRLQAAHAELKALEAQVSAHSDRSGDLQQQLRLVELQRLTCRNEQIVCEEQLKVLRSRCGEYSSQLASKQAELESQRRTLELLDKEVKSEDKRIAAQLAQIQEANQSLHEVREEVRGLRETQAASLRQVHHAQRSGAPQRLELAQLEAEATVLRQQLEAAQREAAWAPPHDGSAKTPSAELREIQEACETARHEKDQLEEQLRAVRQLQSDQAKAEQANVTAAKANLARLHAQNRRAHADLALMQARLAASQSATADMVSSSATTGLTSYAAAISGSSGQSRRRRSARAHNATGGNLASVSAAASTADGSRPPSIGGSSRASPRRARKGTDLDTIDVVNPFAEAAVFAVESSRGVSSERLRPAGQASPADSGLVARGEMSKQASGLSDSEKAALRGMEAAARKAAGENEARAAEIRQATDAAAQQRAEEISRKESGAVARREREAEGPSAEQREGTGTHGPATRSGGHSGASAAAGAQDRGAAAASFESPAFETGFDSGFGDHADDGFGESSAFEAAEGFGESSQERGLQENSFGAAVFPSGTTANQDAGTLATEGSSFKEHPSAFASREGSFSKQSNALGRADPSSGADRSVFPTDGGFGDDFAFDDGGGFGEQTAFGDEGAFKPQPAVAPADGFDAGVAFPNNGFGDEGFDAAAQGGDTAFKADDGFATQADDGFGAELAFDDGGGGFGDGFGDGAFGDAGFGDDGFEDGPAFGDAGFGDADFGDAGFGDADFGDPGFGDESAFVEADAGFGGENPNFADAFCDSSAFGGGGSLETQAVPSNAVAPVSGDGSAAFGASSSVAVGDLEPSEEVLEITVHRGADGLLGLDVTRDHVIRAIVAGSPAEREGKIRVGDVLLAVDGAELDHTVQGGRLQDVMRRGQKSYQFTVLRLSSPEDAAEAPVIHPCTATATAGSTATRTQAPMIHPCTTTATAGSTTARSQSQGGKGGPYSEQMRQLQEMGFDDAARMQKALEATKGDIQAAVAHYYDQ